MCMSQIILTYDLLKDRRVDDVINTLFVSLLYKTGRFPMLPCVSSVIDHNIKDVKMW